jgi:hypothetical protein
VTDSQVVLGSKFVETLETYLFALVSHLRIEFRATEINTCSRHSFGPIRTFWCLIRDPFDLQVSCEY